MVSKKNRKKQLKKTHSPEEVRLILKEECPQKRPLSQRKLEKIAKSITPLVLQEEKNKKYFHYCSYPLHPGILGEKYMEKEKCLERDCNHYKKLYVR